MRHARIALVLLFFVFLSACGTLPNGRRWGEAATLHPGWQRVERAARDAALSPQTWAPLAGAALFSATGWDQRVSDWARDHHPLFGSRSAAGAGSDALAYTTGALYGVTVLAAPDGTEAKPWLKDKIKGGLVGTAALFGSLGITEGLKAASHRPRPDRSDHQSFPSGHATGAAAMATLASRNLDVLPLTPAERTTARVGLGGLVAATCWARVEAGKHYPSDVLAGVAVGHFVSAFLNDAILGLDATAPLRTTLDLSRREAVVGVRGTF